MLTGAAGKTFSPNDITKLQSHCTEINRYWESVEQNHSILSLKETENLMSIVTKFYKFCNSYILELKNLQTSICEIKNSAYIPLTDTSTLSSPDRKVYKNIINADPELELCDNNTDDSVTLSVLPDWLKVIINAFMADDDNITATDRNSIITVEALSTFACR